MAAMGIERLGGVDVVHGKVRPADGTAEMINLLNSELVLGEERDGLVDVVGGGHGHRHDVRRTRTAPVVETRQHARIVHVDHAGAGSDPHRTGVIRAVEIEAQREIVPDQAGVDASVEDVRHRERSDRDGHVARVDRHVGTDGREERREEGRPGGVLDQGGI